MNKRTQENFWVIKDRWLQKWSLKKSVISQSCIFFMVIVSISCQFLYAKYVHVNYCELSLWMMHSRLRFPIKRHRILFLMYLFIYSPLFFLIKPEATYSSPMTLSSQHKPCEEGGAERVWEAQHHPVNLHSWEGVPSQVTLHGPCSTLAPLHQAWFYILFRPFIPFPLSTRLKYKETASCQQKGRQSARLFFLVSPEM